MGREKGEIMKNFIKIEKLVVTFGSNIEPYIWLNKTQIVAVFVKDDLTRISTVDGHTETTRMSIDEVMKLINE